jgi:hypothetical protein
VRAAQLAVLGVVLALGTSGCSSDTSQAGAADSTSAGVRSVALSCDHAVRNGPLPTWARGGFDPPDQDVRYVIGAERSIVGVVFGYPLKAGARKDGGGNKILWVGRTTDNSAATDLEIIAHLNGTSTVVQRAVTGGPGPSLIDLPKAGCWTFDLSWGGGRDRLAVPYGA